MKFFNRKKPHSHTWNMEGVFKEAWVKMFEKKEMEPIITQKCQTCNYSRQIKIGIQFGFAELEK